MKYLKKYNEEIEWEWLDEEKPDFSIIDINELNKDEYDQLLKKLKIGDRYIFDFKSYSKEFRNIKGEIKYLG